MWPGGVLDDWPLPGNRPHHSGQFLGKLGYLIDNEVLKSYRKVITPFSDPMLE
jgi:hypothetical protein